MIVSNSGYISALSQATSTESGSNIADAGGNNLPVENNSSDSVQISEKSRTKMLEELKGGELAGFTGEDGPYRLGLMALGESTVQEWSAKESAKTDSTVSVPPG